MRVLIADDHPLIIEALTSTLADAGIEVVGTALTTQETLERYFSVESDVVVLDVAFHGAWGGLDVAREILRQRPDARILFISQFSTDSVIQDAYGLGGLGFVTKTTPNKILIEAIKQVHEGRTYFLQEIAERLALSRVRGDDSPASKLDAREFEVFSMMALGQTNQEMAESMSLSVKTISTTSQSVKDKLGVQRAAEITILAIKHGLIVP